MKTINLYNIIVWFFLGALLFSCEKDLELQPRDEFSAENVSGSKEGLEALLFSAYQHAYTLTQHRDEILLNEVTTDIAVVRIGAVEREMVPFMNFNWDASIPKLEQFWRPRYKAIRDANTILENIEEAEISEEDKNLIRAEARYIRASSYAYMYRYFGIVPLRITSDLKEQDQNLALPTEEEFRSFVEDELLESVPGLLDPADQKQLGRATKGHAYAVLTKFFMNTKQWEKVVDVSGKLMDLNYYQLFPNYRELFFVSNKGNKEIIVTWPHINQQGFGFDYQNGVFPPGFKESENIPEFTWTNNMANFATQYSVRDKFYDSFSDVDDRKQTIITNYINLGGNLVDLRETSDNVRSLKYWDNDQIGNFANSDIPYIRYADILLSRAEALNELNGPSSEALDLVNQVRTRSINSPYTLSEAGGKTEFRNIILQERGWEFFSEGKRREDLIRQDKFIELAKERGLNAEEKHKFFPYPQKETDANSAIKQREGY